MVDEQSEMKRLPGVFSFFVVSCLVRNAGILDCAVDSTCTTDSIGTT